MPSAAVLSRRIRRSIAAVIISHVQFFGGRYFGRSYFGKRYFG